MAAVAFDTLKAARRMIAAGMPVSQAEAQAEVMAEAFVFNMDALVTRDYLDATLDARFGEQDARIDTRFGTQTAKMEKRLAEQDVKMEKRFAEQNAKMENQFVEQDAKMEKRFAEQDTRFEKRFNQIDLRLADQSRETDILRSDMNGKFRLVFWMLTALIGANGATLSMVYNLSR